MKRLVLAVDLDGTLTDNNYPFLGRPKPGAREALQTFKVWGHEIIIWTCRTLPKDIAEAKKWLKDHDIPYDYFNENSPEAPFPCKPKVYADVYIDDRNLCGFIEWWAVPRMVELWSRNLDRKNRPR